MNKKQEIYTAIIFVFLAYMLAVVSILLFSEDYKEAVKGIVTALLASFSTVGISYVLFKFSRWIAKRIVK